MSCPETGTKLGDARTSEPIHNAGDQPRASTFQNQYYAVIARDTGTHNQPREPQAWNYSPGKLLHL